MAYPGGTQGGRYAPVRRTPTGPQESIRACPNLDRMRAQKNFSAQNGDPTPFDLPVELLVSDVTRHVLPNGLTVLVKEVYPASVVSISIWSRVGSLDESDDAAGISHFLEHMLFKGTPRRPVGKIAQEIHSLGGYLNGFTSYDCTCYWIVLPSRCFEVALDIEVDAILHPLLEPAEIQKEANVIVEELKMYEDRPESYCFQRLMETAFRSHRYRRPIIGYESIIRASGVAELERHYQRFYRPNNLCVVVVGDVRTDAVVRAVEAQLGHLQAGPIVRDERVAEPAQGEHRRLDIDGDITAARLQMGFHIPNVFETDTFACDILASVLGEGRSSRLYRSLREERAMVMSIGASIFAEKDPGLFLIDATLEADRIREAENLIREELERIANDGVTQHEVQKARNMVEAAYIFSQETVEGQGKKLGYYEMMGDYRLADRYTQHLYEVTADDIQRVTQRYLREANCTTVAYRPRQSTAR
jgi:zinc protease